MTILLARDPATHIPHGNLCNVIPLLGSLNKEGAGTHVMPLARRAALHYPPR